VAGLFAAGAGEGVGWVAGCFTGGAASVEQLFFMLRINAAFLGSITGLIVFCFGATLTIAGQPGAPFFTTI